MGRLKNLLKKIVPPSISIFNREINRITTDLLSQSNYNSESHKLIQHQTLELLAGLEEIDNKANSIQEIISEQAQKGVDTRSTVEILMQKNSELSASIAMLAQKIELIESGLDNLLKQVDVNYNQLNSSINRRISDRYYYNNKFERATIKKWGFYNILHGINFTELYLTLVHGLDAKSVFTINEILSRLLKVENTDGIPVDIFTDEEQQALKDLRFKFRTQILKVSDNIYSFQNYLLPIPQFEVSVFYDKHGIEKIQNVERFKSKDIIDVGGFIGDSALILAPLTSRNVYSFEPVKENYEMMLQTLQLNETQNIVPVNLALGSTGQEQVIHVSGSCSTISQPIRDSAYETAVPMSTLDQYVNEHNLEVGLIKVDVEGFEQDFLAGAEQTIRKFKPILLLSIYHGPKDFFGIKPLLESWQLGYQFQIHKPKDGQILFETLLIAQ